MISLPYAFICHYLSGHFYSYVLEHIICWACIMVTFTLQQLWATHDNGDHRKGQNTLLTKTNNQQHKHHTLTVQSLSTNFQTWTLLNSPNKLGWDLHGPQLQQQQLSFSSGIAFRQHDKPVLRRQQPRLWNGFWLLPIRQLRTIAFPRIVGVLQLLGVGSFGQRHCTKRMRPQPFSFVPLFIFG